MCVDVWGTVVLPVSLPFCPCCWCNGDSNSYTERRSLVLCPSWMVSSTEQSSSTSVVLIQKRRLSWLPSFPLRSSSENVVGHSFRKKNSSRNKSKEVNLECCRTCITLPGQVTRMFGRTTAWPPSCTAPNEAGINAKIHSSLLPRDIESIFLAIKSNISTGTTQCQCWPPGKLRQPGTFSSIMSFPPVLPKKSFTCASGICAGRGLLSAGFSCHPGTLSSSQEVKESQTWTTWEQIPWQTGRACNPPLKVQM